MCGIVAVADIFDALRSDRSYRAGIPLMKALEMLAEMRGAELDPARVEHGHPVGIRRGDFAARDLYSARARSG